MTFEAKYYYPTKKLFVDMKMKTLIVYGTRYGATASTSEEIATVLRDEGFDVRVVNAKEEKVHDISEYNLIIVGSGMKIDRWTKEPEKFLKKFKKECCALCFVCNTSNLCP